MFTYLQGVRLPVHKVYMYLATRAYQIFHEKNTV